MSKKLTKRDEDYSKWYNELVVKADLAENSGVRGCMVIKPYGYAIWEKMQAALDQMFKDTGHQNVYFPVVFAFFHFFLFLLNLFTPKNIDSFNMLFMYDTKTKKKAHASQLQAQQKFQEKY